MYVTRALEKKERGRGKVKVKVSSVQLNEATGSDFDSVTFDFFLLCVLLLLIAFTRWSFFISPYYGKVIYSELVSDVS